MNIEPSEVAGTDDSIRERRWATPPPDRVVKVIPSVGRDATSAAVAAHLERELIRGRALYCIVRDRFVEERIDEFDGRALPINCVQEDDR